MMGDQILVDEYCHVGTARDEVQTDFLLVTQPARRRVATKETLG